MVGLNKVIPRNNGQYSRQDKSTDNETKIKHDKLIPWFNYLEIWSQICNDFIALRRKADKNVKHSHASLYLWLLLINTGNVLCRTQRVTDKGQWFLLIYHSLTKTIFSANQRTISHQQHSDRSWTGILKQSRSRQLGDDYDSPIDHWDISNIPEYNLIQFLTIEWADLFIEQKSLNDFMCQRKTCTHLSNSPQMSSYTHKSPSMFEGDTLRGEG